MIPQGAIWQSLRQRSLANIPIGLSVSPKRRPTFSEWLSIGSYTVSVVPGGYKLSASSQEIGNVLLSEAAYHLDHAAEHSVSVRHQLSDARWYSVAWLCVTFYYWAFFLSICFARMLGKSSLFLNKIQATQLHALSGSATASPGAGPFIFDIKGTISLSQIEIELKKGKKSRVHDLAWRIFFDEVKALVNLGKLTNTPSAEQRLYNALERSADLLSPTWPSDLRNLINYAPGVGYGAVRKEQFGNVFSLIKVDPASTYEELLDRLESNVAALRTPTDIARNIHLAAKILVDMTFVLDLLVNALHKEVVDRRGIDQRWPNLRTDFYKNQFAKYSSKEWPNDN